MPVQHTIFGHAVSFSRYRPPRRVLIVLIFAAAFAISTLIFAIDSSIPAIPVTEPLSDGVPPRPNHKFPKTQRPKIPLPSLPNPFRPPAHQPAVQANSSSGQVNWHSHWKWLNPFSSTITLDENRAVLPPLPERPPIYTFYDSTEKKDEKIRQAEGRLILTWRKAWWAQGFRPVILGKAEAMNNPLHESLRRTRKLEPALDAELDRWLAWEHMGSGILASWLALPMAARNDSLLAYLRRGTYPKLTRYYDLGSGLLCGDKGAITAALKQALDNPKFNESKTFLEAVPEEAFDVDSTHEGVAYYPATTVTQLYKSVSEKLEASPAQGLEALAQLINSHLHTTFQNVFSKGIAVLKPLPEHSTALVDPALQVATRLAECPDFGKTADHLSCPPNRLDCIPCDPHHPLHISTPQIFRNASSLYTIGTVPHPYTLVSLVSKRTDINTRYVRRETNRDPWIQAATHELLGKDVGNAPRIVKFKESVASEWDSARSLWITPEKGLPQDLDWHFGFTLPEGRTFDDKSSPRGPGSMPAGLRPDSEGPVPPEKELRQERTLLQTASAAVKSTSRQQKVLRELVEAWNLADTEAWRFVRAYRARSHVERLKWEEEEKKFAGGVGTEGRGSGWGKWFDRGRR
ncbi:MAG: hypothetical protein M1832_001652 [Thelocarpon impressellum]|nr:MAG: hypothetical protein M1832_001652 [Thelocarpon impressellum]